MKVKKKVKKFAFIGGGLLVVGFVLFWVVTSVGIGRSVDKRCCAAQDKYGGECVPALMMWLDDENNDFGSRNSATWALGQLGDWEALPVLRGLYTGEIPEREPWEGVLSQYELKKAIKLLESGINLAAPFWR